MEIVVIGDQHTVTAFRLAGIKRIYGTDEGGENLKKILADDGTGVVVMTERFARDNRKVLEDHANSKINSDNRYRPYIGNPNTKCGATNCRYRGIGAAGS